MPSLRQISTSRSAQLPKAPMAQTVTTCQMPPSFSGASPRPYFRSGGATLIFHGFHTPCSDASYRIRAVPRKLKKTVATPKKPT